MFDLVNGLPVHALVVHAVVILLPLAVAGAVVVVLVPRWRRAYGPLTALVATAGTALVPVATRSGLQLAGRVGAPDGAHQQLGGQLIWYGLALTVLLWAFVLADRRVAGGARGGPPREGTPSRHRGSRALSALAVLVLVAALAAGFQVVRVGESGARSVWGDIVTAPE
ncbi:MAG: DUF2231 domain-containing protein [Georgenia sp.]